MAVVSILLSPIIKSDLNEQSVYDSLRPNIDGNDMLSVLKNSIDK